MAAVLPLTACDGGPTSGETGLISILLTDEPGDFHEAVVTIEGIYLQGDADEDAERVWLREDAVTTDLRIGRPNHRFHRIIECSAG